MQIVRSLGRLRWVAKFHAVRLQGASFREQPLMLLRYVLLDPEFDNFTYELDNASELITVLAGLLDRPEAELSRYLAEATDDALLANDLHGRLRWRLTAKRQPPLGRRYSWYVLARALKPQLIVEAGVQDGLGSLALLRALDRNAAEGHPGQLLSVDSLATAGWMVPAHDRASWRFELGSADEVLERELRESDQVGLFIEDTGAPENVLRREFQAILKHAAPGAIIVAGITSAVLQTVCNEHGLPFVEHRDQAHNHFFQHALTTFAGPTP